MNERQQLARMMVKNDFKYWHDLSNDEKGKKLTSRYKSPFFVQQRAYTT